MSELELNYRTLGVQESVTVWKMTFISISLEKLGYFSFILGQPRGHPLGSWVQSGMVGLFRRIFTLFPGGKTATYFSSWTQWRDDVTPTKEWITECPSVIQVLQVLI